MSKVDLARRIAKAEARYDEIERHMARFELFAEMIDWSAMTQDERRVLRKIDYELAKDWEIMGEELDYLYGPASNYARWFPCPD